MIYWTFGAYGFREQTSTFRWVKFNRSPGMLVRCSCYAVFAEKGKSRARKQRFNLMNTNYTLHFSVSACLQEEARLRATSSSTNAYKVSFISLLLKGHEHFIHLFLFLSFQVVPVVENHYLVVHCALCIWAQRLACPCRIPPVMQITAGNQNPFRNGFHGAKAVVMADTQSI